MNEAEQIRKQLARYESSPETDLPRKSAPADETGGSIWDPKLPEDWKPEPRYVKEEPDYSAGFKVGDFWPESRWTDGHLERQGLPHPNYEGKPGDLITPEIEETYWNKYQVWSSASSALERCIRLHLNIREFQDSSHCHPDKEELKQMLAEQWEWLRGLWAATPGMNEPTEKQLDTWADELRARYDAQKKHGAVR